MKKRIALLVAVIMIFTSFSSMVFADTGELLALSRDMVIYRNMKEGAYLKTKELSTRKLSENEKKHYLCDSNNINVEESEVFVIERVLDENTYEISVITECALEKSTRDVALVEPGTASQSHVVVYSKLEYNKINRNGKDFYKGTAFGGYVVDRPTNTTFSYAEAKYTESGYYITATGGSGRTTSDYVQRTIYTNTNLDSEQMANLNRTRFFDPDAPSTTLASQFTVRGKVINGSYETSFDITAISPLILNGMVVA